MARKTEPGRKCSICEHESLDQINTLLLKGETYRKISERFSVSAAALSRHKNQHIPKAMTKAQEAQEVAQADNLLEQVQNLQAKALSILAKAEAAGDLRTALQRGKAILRRRQYEARVTKEVDTLLRDKRQ